MARLARFTTGGGIALLLSLSFAGGARAANIYDVETGACSSVAPGVVAPSVLLTFDHTTNIGIGDTVRYTVGDESANCPNLYASTFGDGVDYAVTMTVNGDVYLAPKGLGPAGGFLPSLSVGDVIEVTVTAGSLDLPADQGFALMISGTVPGAVGAPFATEDPWAALVHLSSTPDALPETGSSTVVPLLAAIVLAAGVAVRLAAAAVGRTS